MPYQPTSQLSTHHKKREHLLMIFYFSCTGNTLWAAQTVAKATNDRTVNIATELKRSATPALTYTLDNGEPMAFFFPVHGWRPPMTVRNFVRKLRISGDAHGHYCYAVCTAGDTVGEAMDIMEADLAAVGITVDSAVSLLMPESYVGLPFMDVDTPANERRKIEAAAERLEAFVQDVKARRCGIHDIAVGNWPRINSRVIGAAFVNWIIGDRQFAADPSRCIGCGLCIRQCPVGDIAANADGTPMWQHNGECLQCFACYHHCPTRAIEYGRRTRRKGQYYFKPDPKQRQ